MCVCVLGLEWVSGGSPGYQSVHGRHTSYLDLVVAVKRKVNAFNMYCDINLLMDCCEG